MASYSLQTLRLLALALFALGLQRGPAQTLPAFDFTQPADTVGWAPTHHISSLTTTPTGMVAQIAGFDPYTIGPARDYPASQPLWLRLKLFSEAGGGAQVFYFSNIATEASSVRFTVPAGQWTEGRVPVPSLGPGFRMRIDPPGTNGAATLAHLRFEPRGEFPEFDFTTVPDATSWTAQHDISSLVPGPDGLAVNISGSDPYMAGPARDYPEGKLLWLHLQLKSEQAGTGQVFYYQTGPEQSNSVRFYVPAGVWHEAVVPVPALGAGWRLRLDPPGGSGSSTLRRLWFEERVIYPPPAWPVPVAPVIAPNALQLASGDLHLAHNPDALGAFRVDFAGQVMATGNPEALIGYALGKQTRWMALASGAGRQVITQLLTNGFLVRHDALDPDGASWRIEQRFTTNTPNAIDVESRITVNANRQVLYLPAFTLLAGLGTHGTNKSQGLLPGLEYLENEPSSSELDITGDGARRLVPDSKKITFPLMAIAASNHCLGLLWEPQSALAPVFDSPDRQFQSGGHVLGLLFPGSDGFNRDEGSLLPYAARLLSSNDTVVVRCTILGSAGNTVVPAVRQYVALRGLPALPAGVPTAAEYYLNAAHGWLDSDIRTNGLLRHAVWPGFNPQPAADAAVWMRWLAEHVNEGSLAASLSNVASTVLAQVTNPALYNNAAIGHVRYPLPALIFGSVLTNAVQSRTDAANQLGRFQPDGTVLYVPPSGGTDLGATHYAPDANGLTATVVASSLNEALFSGDRSLIGAAMDKLRAMDKFRETVPRGAQTWEVPLHTPDILASAYLVISYLNGYHITGDTDLLDQARYWAWTGVPFIYLSPPVPGNVGLYSTIPVFGATHWVGSWLGRPVQWCGLVYGEALYQLALADPGGPWKRLADGIAASGTQQTWPVSDASRQGLLPDFYLLQPQVSDGPAINPGTLQSQALQFYSGSRPYTFYSLRSHGLFVHAPGSIGGVTQEMNSVTFTVTNWIASPAWVMVAGLTGAPGVRLNGIPTTIAAPHQYDASRGLLILSAKGVTTIQLAHPALPRLDIKTVANASVELSWPVANSNFVLQSTTSLLEPGSWSNSAAPVGVKGERRVVNEPAGAEVRFFRLRSLP